MNKFFICAVTALTFGAVALITICSVHAQNPQPGPPMGDETRQETALTSPCFLFMQDSAFFTVPAFQGDPNTLMGVEFRDFLSVMDGNYGFENLTNIYVGKVMTRRYMAHAVRIPGSSYPYALTQPSISIQSLSDEIFPFDGVIDAQGFDTYNFASPVPDGDSGYWGGGLSGPVFDSQGHLIPEGQALFPSLQLYTYAAEGKAFWKGDRSGKVTLEYRPWGYYSHDYSLSGPLPTGHWEQWVDHIHGYIRSIRSIVYQVDTNDDGIADYEQEWLL